MKIGTGVVWVQSPGGVKRERLEVEKVEPKAHIYISWGAGLYSGGRGMMNRWEE